MASFVGISKRQFKKAQRYKSVLQEHHYSYMKAPVKVRKGEHLCLTWMGRMSWVSSQFLECLRGFIKWHEGHTIDL